jgi:hypothetical protein
MGGSRAAGIPASTPRNRPFVFQKEKYPTRNKSSETAEITGKLREKYNWFGMRGMGWERGVGQG